MIAKHQKQTWLKVSELMEQIGITQPYLTLISRHDQAVRRWRRGAAETSLMRFVQAAIRSRSREAELQLALYLLIACSALAMTLMGGQILMDVMTQTVSQMGVKAAMEPVPTIVQEASLRPTF